MSLTGTTTASKVQFTSILLRSVYAGRPRETCAAPAARAGCRGLVPRGRSRRPRLDIDPRPRGDGPRADGPRATRQGPRAKPRDAPRARGATRDGPLAPRGHG